MKQKDFSSAPRFVRPFGFVVFLVISAGVGTFLRLYLFADQILLDDEWHALFYTPYHSLSYLLQHPTFGANCAPLNAYFRALLVTVGWSEELLRLPALVPGILALIGFPLLVKKAHGNAAAAVFAAFSALSPFLTFYSRVCRQYSMLVLLLFISLYAGGFWLLSGKAKYQWLYVLVSSFAVYFHPVAIITVFVPLALGCTLGIVGQYFSGFSFLPKIYPRWWHLLIAGILISAATALTVHPSIVSTVQTHARPNRETWEELILMLFGTSSFGLAISLLILSGIGAIYLLRTSLYWGLSLILVAAINLIAIALSGLDAIYAAIVFARYVIILFPVTYVCAAVGLKTLLMLLDRIFEGRPMTCGAIRAVISVCLFGSLVITNPLWITYGAPNNFTNHSAFQESYRLKRPLQPYRSAAVPDLAAKREPEMSAFYKNLPSTTKCLIEYPTLAEDHLNFYYYYQQQHRKRVVAGYAALAAPELMGVTSINYISDIPQKQLHFRNAVNILDAEAVKKTSADYLIIHLNSVSEFLPGRIPFEETRTQGIDLCLRKLQETYGLPVYDDLNIVVFDLGTR